MKRKQRIRIGEDHKVPPSPCTDCGKILRGALGLSSKLDDRRILPTPGALTICGYCGHVMAFADDLTLRDLTDDEIDDAAGNELMLALQRARAEITKKDR